MEGRIGVEHPADRWYELMRSALSERFPEICFSVVNSAVGGESTREIMGHLDLDLAGHSADFVLIMAGANNHDMTRPERILKPGEMIDWMERFLKKIPAKSQTIGIILSPVINEYHFATHHPAYQEYLQETGGLDEALEKERDEAREFFRKHTIPILDLKKIMQPPEQFVLREDGIPLSAAGHRFFAEKITEILSGHLTAQ